MSRCFPFPRIGYAGNCAINDALIFSIKLQEEWQNSIPSRVRNKINDSDNKKDRKREKKDKKKVRKGKSSDVKEIFHSATQSEKQKFSDKSHKVDSTGKQFKGKLNFDVFEQSNLTEEHGRSVNSQNVSHSSDSTENSCKRKWDSPPACSIQGTGNIVRIRLSSQNRDDPIAMDCLPSQKSDWTSKIQEPSICRNDVISKVWEPLHFDKKITSSSSGRVVNIKPPLKKLSSHERKLLKRESLYKNLFNNSVSNLLVSSIEANKNDDDDWLFGKKDEEILAKRQRGMDNLSCSVSAIQPHAHLLSNVEVYALPFTVPF